MSVKLSTAEVYNKMRPLIYPVNTSIGESSSFLLENGVMVTVAHNIPLSDPMVQISYARDKIPLFPKPLESINIKNAIALDIYALKTEIDGIDVLPCLPEAIKLYEGMKVYFAGFPLGHEEITFHKGLISSLRDTRGIKEFTIDGTVVPGNSGGPVVAMHDNVPYLIGIITSEMADFSPEDLRTIAIMKALKEKKEAEVKPLQNSNTMRLDQNGVTVPIQITNEQGINEIVHINDRDTTILALDLIQRNLSTGIGRAVDIREFKYLTGKDNLSETGTSTYFFQTGGKGKGLVKGSIGESSKQEFLKYIEVRYGGSGGGPRGIQITMSDGSGTYIYKFLENPHTAPGNYNKNQKELYDKAALAFATNLQNDTPPEIFSFEACKSTYTANKEMQETTH